MGNEWVEFVRKFAKDNNITYSRAIKEAGPAYRKIKKDKPTWTGKGLGDLPDETQSDEIGSFLDDKSLLELSKTNQGINKNRGIIRDLENRRIIRPAEANRLLGEVQQFYRAFSEFFYGNSHSIAHIAPVYFKKMEYYVELLKQIRDNPLLDGEQGLHIQDEAQRYIPVLERFLNDRKSVLQDLTREGMANEPRSMRRKRNLKR